MRYAKLGKIKTCSHLSDSGTTQNKHASYRIQHFWSVDILNASKQVPASNQRHLRRLLPSTKKADTSYYCAREQWATNPWSPPRRWDPILSKDVSRLDDHRNRGLPPNATSWQPTDHGASLRILARHLLVLLVWASEVAYSLYGWLWSRIEWEKKMNYISIMIEWENVFHHYNFCTWS